VNGSRSRWAGAALLAPAYGLILVLVLVPLAALIVASLTPARVTGASTLGLLFENYLRFFRDAPSRYVLMNSLSIPLLATLLSLGIGWPLAYALAKVHRRRGNALLAVLMAPFFVSYLLIIYAFMGLLQVGGPVQAGLHALGLVPATASLLYTRAAVTLALVYEYLPFMVLSIYGSLERVEDGVLEAAAGLGAGGRRLFAEILWPRSVPGVVAGCALVFIPATGSFVEPQILGGTRVSMLGEVIDADQPDVRPDPRGHRVADADGRRGPGLRPAGGAGVGEQPRAAAVSRMRRGGRSALWTAFTALVFTAMFVPIAYLVVMSFNTSPYGTLPWHFTTQWYDRLFHEPALAQTTLRTLLMSAVVAAACAVAGTMAALGMARYRLPRPLVDALQAVNLIPVTVPWLVLGVTMLLFLLLVGSGRSVLNLYLGNTVVVLPYVTLLVTTRLRGERFEQEEAGAQLGASPARIFLAVTLPRLAPSILAGSIMAFMVSFNNFLLQYYLAPFGFSTLSMEIYGLVRSGVRPDINALSTFLVLASVTLVMTLDRLVGIGSSFGAGRHGG